MIRNAGDYNQRYAGMSSAVGLHILSFTLSAAEQAFENAAIVVGRPSAAGLPGAARRRVDRADSRNVLRRQQIVRRARGGALAGQGRRGVGQRTLV
jgi:hypothetical protein